MGKFTKKVVCKILKIKYLKESSFKIAFYLIKEMFPLSLWKESECANLALT